MNNLVSIVIPTHNRKAMVTNLIRSLLSGTYKNIEIIVIDDASSDGTYEYLTTNFKEEKRVIIKSNKKNLFAAGSKNVGIKYAHGTYIAFIDDDNLADKQMIGELVRVLQDNPDAGEVGPINYVMARKNKVLLSKSTRNMLTSQTKHIRTLSNFTSDYWETDDIPNAFMVKSEILKKFQITFRRKFGIMYEESDFAYRIRNAGYKIYFVKKSKIYHDVELGDKDFVSHFMYDPRRPYVFARNRVIFHSLYSSEIQKIAVIFFWVWVFAAYYSYKFVFFKSNVKVGLRQKFEAMFSYIKGTLDGIELLLTQQTYSFINK